MAGRPKCNPQSALGPPVLHSVSIRNPPMRNTQHRARRLELELCGPRDGLESGPRSSRGVRSAPTLVDTPNPPPKRMTVRAQERPRKWSPEAPE
eukprot:10989273-Alexandrium_andersonii.AAC.1